MKSLKNYGFIGEKVRNFHVIEIIVHIVLGYTTKYKFLSEYIYLSDIDLIVKALFPGKLITKVS